MALALALAWALALALAHVEIVLQLVWPSAGSRYPLPGAYHVYHR